MKVVDLELYKWQLHRMGAFSTLKLKPRSMGLSKFHWWLECGAFISMGPRQSGKTELLIRMAKILQQEGEEFIFVVPNNQIKKEILYRLPVSSSKIEVLQTATTALNFQNLSSEKVKNTNLLVDEYMMLRKDALRNLFSMEWKSISMSGGLTI